MCTNSSAPHPHKYTAAPEPSNHLLLERLKGMDLPAFAQLLDEEHHEAGLTHLAADASTPASVLRLLAVAYPDKVATNPNAAPEVLTAIMDEYPEFAEAIIANPAFNLLLPELLAKVRKHRSSYASLFTRKPSLFTSLAKASNLPPLLEDALLDNKHLRYLMLDHPRHPELIDEVLDDLLAGIEGGDVTNVDSKLLHLATIENISQEQAERLFRALEDHEVRGRHEAYDAFERYSHPLVRDLARTYQLNLEKKHAELV